MWGVSGVSGNKGILLFWFWGFPLPGRGRGLSKSKNEPTKNCGGCGCVGGFLWGGVVGRVQFQGVQGTGFRWECPPPPDRRESRPQTPGGSRPQRSIPHLPGVRTRGEETRGPPKGEIFFFFLFGALPNFFFILTNFCRGQNSSARRFALRRQSVTQTMPLFGWGGSPPLVDRKGGSDPPTALVLKSWCGDVWVLHFAPSLTPR